MNDIMTIDGVTFAVNILDFEETSQFLDKYAERTEDWTLRRELAGILFNYELTLGEIQSQATMQALWDKLHEFVEFHEVTLPHDEGLQTYQAYVTGCKRPLKKRVNGVNTWGGFGIKFIAKAPQITS
jgi:hypothetical protein